MKREITKFGQFREGSKISGEKLEILWYHNGNLEANLTGKVEWTLPVAQAKGEWKVEVEFITPEVRKNLDLLKASSTIMIS